MKKLFTMLALLLMSVTMFACSFVFANASQTVALPNASDIVADCASYAWTNQGVSAELNSTNNIVRLQSQIDATESKVWSMKFKVAIQNSQGVAIDGTSMDIIYTDVQTGESAFLRLWLNAGADSCSGQVGHIVGSDWIMYNTTPWFWGDSNAAEFKVGFSQTQQIMALNTWNNFEYIPLAEGSTEGYQVLQSKFANSETVQVSIRVNDLADGKATITFIELNGQSMANDGTNINDNVAPVVPKIKETAPGTQYETATDYVLAAPNWYETPTGNFNMRPTYDALGLNSISKQVYAQKGEETAIAMPALDKINFPSAGDWKLWVKATDLGGNVTEGTPITVNVKQKKLDQVQISLDGELNSYYPINQAITLPQASAFAGSVACDVVTSVTLNGDDVALNSGAFTPTATGKYVVTFTSTLEGDSENTATITKVLTVYNPEDYTADAKGKDLFIWTNDYTFSEEGVILTSPNWSGAGIGSFFDVRDGRELSIKFKMPVYQTGTNNFIDENYKLNVIDIILKDAERPSDDYSKTIVIRIDGGSYNPADGRIRIRITTGDGAGVEGIENDNGTTVFCPTWMWGQMSPDHEFHIGFNTTDFVKYDFTGDTGIEKVDYSGNEAYYSAMQAFFGDTRYVQAYWRVFSYNATDAASSQNKLILTEVNGQRYENFNGNFNDTVAPHIPELVLKKNIEFNSNKEYEFAIKGSPTDTLPATASVYAPFTEEIISAMRLQWKVKVQKGTEEPIVYEDLKFVLPTPGTWTVTLIATDFGGNEGSASIEITAYKGYDITLAGSIVESTKVGDKITLPTATASDRNGVARDVVITVEDYNGTPIILDADNSFVPNATGIYYVKYTSSYSEDGQTYNEMVEKEIFVTEAEKEEKSGCSSSIQCVSSAIVMSLALLGSVCVLIIKNKKHSNR